VAPDVTRWISSPQLPDDVYLLLGLRRFHASREEVLAAIRQANRSLHPYQQHRDASICERGLALQMQLAKFMAELEDAAKTRQYQSAVLDALADRWRSREGDRSDVELRRWLEADEQVDLRWLGQVVAVLLAEGPSRSVAAQEFLDALDQTWKQQAQAAETVVAGDTEEVKSDAEESAEGSGLLGKSRVFGSPGQPLDPTAAPPRSLPRAQPIPLAKAGPAAPLPAAEPAKALRPIPMGIPVAAPAAPAVGDAWGPIAAFAPATSESPAPICVSTDAPPFEMQTRRRPRRAHPALWAGAGAVAVAVVCLALFGAWKLSQGRASGVSTVAQRPAQTESPPPNRPVEKPAADVPPPATPSPTPPRGQSENPSIQSGNGGSIPPFGANKPPQDWPPEQPQQTSSLDELRTVGKRRTQVAIYSDFHGSEEIELGPGMFEYWPVVWIEVEGRKFLMELPGARLDDVTRFESGERVEAALEVVRTLRGRIPLSEAPTGTWRGQLRSLEKEKELVVGVAPGSNAAPPSAPPNDPAPPPGEPAIREIAQPAATVDAGTGEIQSLAWDRAGSKLAAGSDRQVTVCNADGEGARTVGFHDSAVTAVDFLASGRYLLTYDGRIRLTDLEAGLPTAPLNVLPGFNTHPFASLGEKGNRFVAAVQGEVRLMDGWETRDRTWVNARISSVQASQDGSYFACGQNDGFRVTVVPWKRSIHWRGSSLGAEFESEFRIWKNPALKARPEKLPLDAGSNRKLDWSAAGDWLAYSRGRELRVLPRKGEPISVPLAEGVFSVKDVKWSPMSDSNVVAVAVHAFGPPGHHVLLWDASAKESLARLIFPATRERPPATPEKLAWRPDGRALAVGTDRGTVLLFDAAEWSK
jgi:hypothetical protein